MIAWRLIKARYADAPLSTNGAVAEGGRWNEPGTPLLYCSEHLSLAALEVLVHLSPNYRHTRYLALELAIPDDAPVTRWDVHELPEDWKTLVGSPRCTAQGSNWAISGVALVLSVPSVIVPQESNTIVNGLHSAFKRVQVRSSEPFYFDDRL